MDHPRHAPTPAAVLIRLAPAIALGVALAAVIAFGFVAVVLHLYEAREAPTTADPRAMILLSIAVNVTLFGLFLAVDRIARRKRDGTRSR